jgi:predicted kinase
VINLHLTYGLSASGKSTWAREFALSEGLIRLSMDDVRATLGTPSGSLLWTKEFEGLAFSTMLAMARSLVKEGRGVIFDNTHLSSSMPSQIAKAFRHQNVSFHVKDFTHVPREVCLERDALRPDGVRVGPDVINRQAKIVRTAKLGGLPFRLTSDWLNSFNILPHIESYIPNRSLPKAFIVDMDGTLTLGPHNRSPYEWHKVGQDLPRVPIVDLARMLRSTGRRLLVLSGRSESCRRETLQWLESQLLTVDRLIMRKVGDNRSDDLVKLSLFNDHVRDHYRVEQVFDDRNQVVTLWRLLGLQCNQVAPGEF